MQVREWRFGFRMSSTTEERQQGKDRYVMEGGDE